MVCKFCAAEMLRIILDNQNCCARMTDAKNEMLVIEILKNLKGVTDAIYHKNVSK